MSFLSMLLSCGHCAVKASSRTHLVEQQPDLLVVARHLGFNGVSKSEGGEGGWVASGFTCKVVHTILGYFT